MNITDLIIPPWAKLVAGLLPIVALVGGIGWLDHSRNHWKATAANEKTQIAMRDSLVRSYQAEIRSMTTAQDDQTKISHLSVQRVVDGPTMVQTIVKHIHDAPNPANCATPDLAYARANT